MLCGKQRSLGEIRRLIPITYLAVMNNNFCVYVIDLKSFGYTCIYICELCFRDIYHYGTIHLPSKSEIASR